MESKKAIWIFHFGSREIFHKLSFNFNPLILHFRQSSENDFWLRGLCPGPVVNICFPFCIGKGWDFNHIIAFSWIIWILREHFLLAVSRWTNQAGFVYHHLCFHPGLHGSNYIMTYDKLISLGYQWHSYKSGKWMSFLEFKAHVAQKDI